MKRIFFWLLGMGVFVFLTATVGFAQQYHIVYSGSDFQGKDSTDAYETEWAGVYATAAEGALTCGVHFPDSANGMSVQRVSMSVRDNSDSYFGLVLFKKDRWTGNLMPVAELSTFGLPKSSSVQYVNLPKSQMSAYRIDNTRYSWAMLVVFEQPGANDFLLEQVTIRYY